MKAIIKSFILVAAAAMGFTACQKEIQEEIPVNEGTVQVTFVSGSPETKTTVDTSGDTPVFAWDENETFAVLEQTDALAEASSVAYEKVDGKANITATFASNAGKESYNYVTVYPASGYVKADELASVTLSLPAVQTMAESSYDPAADLMVSEVVTTTAQPAEAQMVRFTRMAAVVKMSLKNLALADGDAVEQVIFTADGKNLAGTVTADLADPHNFTVAAGVDNVTVNTTSSSDVYFTVLPTTLEAGDAYTVVVITNKKLYIKKGTIGEGKTLDFKKGMVTRLGVDMKDVAPSDKWVLVKDASTLKQGDVVTIAAKNYNYVIGKQASNYPIASQTEVVKFGDYLYHPVATSETSVDNRIQHYTLLQRDNNRVAFDFYNDKDYEGDTFIGFVFANGSNYSPKLQDFCDKNTLFDVEITDDAVTLTASEIERTYKYWRYYHSTSAGSRRFDCTSSKPTGNNQICLYKLEGAVGTIPTVAANVIVPDSDESVVIAEEGAAVATDISTEQVTFNYVGPWTISAEAESEWLDVAYDATNNCLTYTAEANTGAKRETTVTITASLEGQESLTWSFKVTQKGASLEISIEEFAKKGQDVNTVYKLTGIITEIPSSTSGKWKLADENGNTAQVQYLKTEAGAYVKGNVDVKVGDVISLTTVVAGTTVGLGGNSSYPAIYKGHYTLTATASGSVGYEGGSATVNVKVEKFGHVVNPPTSISVSEVKLGEAAHDDYSFTDNGDGTATAVVNLDENTGGGSREVKLDFTAGSPLVVSTSISVMQDVNPALKTGWWLVTDVNDLKAGDKIIIAATGLDYAISTAANTNNRKSTAITKNGGALEDVSSSVQQYALEIDSNGLYSFKGTLGDDADKYIYASSSSSNYMKVTSTLDDNGKFTVAIASDGAATIIAQGSNTRNHMQYNNKSTSSPAFYCTDGSFGAVCLYKLYE